MSKVIPPNPQRISVGMYGQNPTLMICSEYSPHPWDQDQQKGQKMNQFPKPLNTTKNGHKVTLHKTPNIGEMFWAMSGIGKDKTVQHFVVVDVVKYPRKFQSGEATRITWKDQNGKFYTSGLKSKSMTKANSSKLKQLEDKTTNYSG